MNLTEWKQIMNLSGTAINIDDIPSEIEVAPVRHGKWIRWRDLNGIKRCKCSECIVSYGNMDTPYCPNCGAKMDGERKEE